MFYSCWCGEGARKHFFLAKEASCAAFWSLPPSTLGLWHHLRTTAWDTAVAPDRGRSYPQETSYGFGCGSLWTLAGVIHALGRGRPSPPSAAWLQFAAWCPPSLSTPSGEGDYCPRHQVLAMGIAKIKNRFAFLCHARVMEEAHVAATSLPAAPAFWGVIQVANYNIAGHR